MATKKSIQALVLAAGRSTRFKTDQTKLGFLICGQEMVAYPIKLLHKLDIPITMIVGHQKEVVKDIIKRHGIEINYAEQTQQKGTGHAVLCSRQYWHAENILIMVGDAPLITEDIIQELIDTHHRTRATITFVAAHNSDPSLKGYGRIVKTPTGIKIVEQADMLDRSCAERCCINAGIYLVKRSFLEASIEHLQPSSKTGELYLTELVGQASTKGLKVEIIHAPFDLVIGINTLKELWTAEHIKRSELIAYWMTQGVRFSTAQNIHIDIDVTIGAGSFIGSGALLIKGTRIGTNCWIEAFSFISNSVIQDNATILSHSVIFDSTICSNARVGPFVHIRNGSVIGEQSHIGNFVEVNASHIGEQSKAKHLSYLGNAVIGSSVNIGAGTITCNFDGFEKHQTTIKDGVFIGSNNALIAPITIGAQAITAAGSTITEDVPDNALGIARAQQVNKEGGAAKIRAKKRAQQQDPTFTCTPAQQAKTNIDRI